MATFGTTGGAGGTSDGANIPGSTPGGAGGANGEVGKDGTGRTAGNFDGSGGGGGGAGAKGGKGGDGHDAGGTYAGGAAGSAGAAGGEGGPGGDAGGGASALEYGGGGGGGGGGGTALTLSDSTPITVTTDQIGGKGGKGGDTKQGGGGGGGAGGNGIDNTGGATVTVQAGVMVRGGQGGDGGNASLNFSKGGQGGGGGVGYFGGGTLINAGTIEAGQAGTSGTSAGTAGPVVPGSAAVVGSDLSVTNTGTITGRTGQDAITFSGGQGNKLTIGSGGTQGVLNGAIGITGALALDPGTARGVAAVLATVIHDTSNGAGSVTKVGAGTLILTGAETYTGTTTIAAGTLQIGNGGTAGSIASTSAISNAGTLAVNRTDALTISQAISGAGALRQAGTGTLTLSGDNTYSGSTTISAGTLKAGSTKAFGAGSAVTDDGTLDLGGFSNTVGSLQGGGVVTNSGTTAATLTVGSSDGRTFSGVIQDGSADGQTALTKVGSNSLYLTGANTYTGVTKVSGGALWLGNNSNSGSLDGSSAIVLENDSKLVLHHYTGTYKLTQAISGAGSLTLDGYNSNKAIEVLTGDSTYSGATIINSGTTLQLGDGGTTGSIAGTSGITDDGILAIKRSDALTVDKVISGIGSVQQIGTGTTTLSGVNTYNGSTTIAAGTLAVSSDGNLGAASGGPSYVADAHKLIFTGGTLEATAGFTSSRAVTLMTTGTVQVDKASDTLVLAGVVANASSTPSTPGNLTKTGDGTLTLSGVNTYTGATTVAAGTLQAGSTSAFGVRSAVTDDARIDLAGFSQTVGSLEGSGVVTNSAASTTATLTVGALNTALVTFAGKVEDGAGKVALTKEGTGTQVLTGTETYSGGTRITAGTLQVGDGMAAGSGASLGTGAVVDDAALVIDRLGVTTIVNDVSGTGSVTVEGTGATGELTFSGALTQTGGFTVSDASNIRIAATGSYVAGSAVVLNGGAFTNLGRVDVSADDAVLGLAGGETITNGAVDNASASITGVASGVSLQGRAASTVKNYGQITGTGNGVGQVRGDGSVTVNNLNGSAGSGGVIDGQGQQGAGWGVFNSVGTGLTVLNESDAKIVGAYDGVFGTGAGTFITNAGTIASGSYDAATGMITSGGLAGIQLLAGGSVANTGLIAGGIGILSDFELKLDNAGMITGLNGDGVTVNASSTLLNRGMIQSTPFSGISMGGSSTTLTVVNAAAGIISGGADTTYGYGVQVAGFGSAASIDNYGSIAGEQGGIVAYNDGLVTANLFAGSTTGLIRLGNANDTVSLYTGAVTTADDVAADPITGSAVVVRTAGTHGQAAHGTIELGGGFNTLDLLGEGSDTGTGLPVTGEAGTLDLSTVTGARTVQKGDGGTWTLTGTATDANAGALVANAGTLVLAEGASFSTNGVFDYGSPVAVVVGPDGTFQNEGTITSPSTGDGLQLRGGTFINIGTLVGAGFNGVYAFYGTGIIRNTGSISGNVGVYAAPGGPFTATGSGTITGTVLDGIYVGQYAGDTTLGTADAALGAVSGGTNGISVFASGTYRTDIVTGGTVSGMNGDGIVVRGDAGSLLGAGPISITANGDVVGTEAGIALSRSGIDTTVTVGGSATVSGGVGLTVDGGVTTLSNGGTIASTDASGSAIRIDSGTLRIGDAVGTITGSIADSGTLAFVNTGAITFGTVIKGSGTVSQEGSGTTILTGANTYTGDTTISGGILQLGDGGTTGSLSAATTVSNDAVLAVDHSGVFALSNVVAGTGSVRQIGTGVLVLKGDSSYGGGTLIESGTLELAGATTGSFGAITSAAAGTGAIGFSSGAQTLRINPVALGFDEDRTLANVIQGFAADGDLIDVRGISQRARASFDYDTNILKLTGPSGDIVLATLHLTGSYAGYLFTASSDGQGGSQVSLSASTGAITAALASDTGSSNSDRITSDPTISGTTNPGAIVTFAEGGVTLDTVVAGANGRFSASFRTSDGRSLLTDGDHRITVTESYVGQTTTGPDVTFTLDTREPAVPTLALAFDTGLSATDRVTSNPAIAYTASAAGDTLLYSRDGATYSTTAPVFATDGTADGQHTVSVQEQDAAGNTSAAASLTFTLDTRAPAVPTLALAFDTGLSATDRVTSNPAIAYTASAAGDTLLYSRDGATYSTTAPVFATDGTADGQHTVSVQEQDAAGNTSAAVNLTFTLDTRAPAAALTLTGPASTSAAAVEYAVTLSEAVSGVDTSDFRVSTTGSSAGVAVTNVTRTDASHYTVAVSTGTSDGRISLTVVAAGSGITDTAGNALRSDAASSAYGVTHAPVAVNDALAALAHTVATGSVLGNDLDPDGDALQVTSIRFSGAPAIAVPGSGTVTAESDFGSLTIAADGRYSYIAASPGQEAFTYTVSDGNGGSASATLSVVTAPHAPDGEASFNFGFLASTLSFVHGEAVLTGPDGVARDVTGIGTLRFTDGTIVEKDGAPLVDDLFYYAKYRDVYAAGFDADTHYVQSGWREGRDPSALFSTKGYLAANPDVAQAGVNPLAHYDVFGWKESRNPGPAFDTRSYLAFNPDVVAAGLDPLAHYLSSGQQEGRPTFSGATIRGVTGDFDANFYIAHNPDVAASGVDPFLHFLNSGWHEGRDPDAFFSTAGYLAANPDVAARGIDPLLHYEAYGWREGRNPSSIFSTNGYLSANPDVAAAHIDPLQHYLQYGQAEGRHGWEI